MLKRLAGSLLRAMLVVILVTLPTLLLPATTADVAQIVLLVALCAGVFVISEYSATYPSFVEFRDAPPFNRIRFISLFLTIFLLSVVWRNQAIESGAGNVITSIGNVIGLTIDFPYSPVRLVMEMFPRTTDANNVALIRICAGVAYLISLMTLVAFVVMARLKGWPNPGRSLNVWVNLPTFDPTAGGDVVKRLMRDAHINVLLGFVLPFIVPVVIRGVANVFEPVSATSSQSLIWTVAIWAFLPTSFFMRGIAMGRIGTLILHERQESQLRAEREDADFAPV